jgi:hypothetical protein
MIKESEQLKKSTVVKKCYNEHDCTHVNYAQYIINTCYVAFVIVLPKNFVFSSILGSDKDRSWH